MSGPPGAGRQPLVLAARSALPDDRMSEDSNHNQAATLDPRQPGGRPKRTLIESACSACRRRKSRCDGVRPACSRCQTLRTDCSYEAEEGESRWSALRRRNQILETERMEMRELMSYLQTRPEQEAQDIFQRIRSGGYEDAFGLLKQLREGGLPSPGGTFPGQAPAFLHRISSNSSTASDQRLPPIRSMFDVSAASAPPPLTVPAMSAYSSGEPSSAHSVSSRSRGSHSSTDYPLTSTAQ